MTINDAIKEKSFEKLKFGVRYVFIILASEKLKLKYNNNDLLNFQNQSKWYNKNVNY